MALDIALRKSTIGQQALSFLGPKICTKVSHNAKKVNTKTSFTHSMKKEIFAQTVGHSKSFTQFSLII